MGRQREGLGTGLGAGGGKTVTTILFSSFFCTTYPGLIDTFCNQVKVLTAGTDSTHGCGLGDGGDPMKTGNRGRQ